MLIPFPDILVLGAASPTDHCSFHLPTQPGDLGLGVLTSHFSLSKLGDFCHGHSAVGTL